MFITMCSFVLGVGFCAGNDTVFEIEPFRLGLFSGTTQFAIDGDALEWGEDWRSRLKFPVDNTVLGTGFGVMFGKAWEVRARAWGTLVRQDAGTLKDYDWVGGDLFAWSDSDAELSAFGVSTEATIWALSGETGALGPRFRLEYDQLDYSVSNVRQFSTVPELNVSYPGRCLTYRQERVSLIPAIAGTLWPADWLEAGGFVGASPFNYVWDHDNHLLRDKSARMATWGCSVLVGLHADYIIDKNIRIGLWGEYLYYESYTGNQDQRLPGDENNLNNIDGDIKRSTTMGGIRIAVNF